MLARVTPDQLAEILDVAEDGIVTVDVCHQVVLFNRGAAKIFGYTPEEVVGKPLDLLLPERFREPHRGQVGDFARSPAHARLMGERREVYGRRKDGTEFPAEISISKFGAGAEMLFTAIVRDVTERKRWEAERAELGQLRGRAELHAARAKLDALVLAARDGVVMLDGAGRVTFLNTAAERLFGVPTGAAAGWPVTDLVGGDYAVPTADTVPDLDPVSEVTVAAADGRPVSVELSRSRVYDDGRVVWLLIARDLTERRRAEGALQASENRLRLALDAGRMGTWEWDVGTDRVHWDGAMFDLLGVTRSSDPLTADVFFERVHPDERPALRQALTDASGPGGRFETEFRIVRPDGAVRWLAGKRSTSPEPGNGLQMRGVNYDVTDRRHAEENLRESERRFRELLEKVQLIAVTLDVDGRVMFCNDFLLGLTGWRAEEVLGRSWFDTFVPEGIRAELKRVFFHPALREEIPVHYENEILTRTGDRRLVAWNNTVLRDAEGRLIGTTSLGEDITNRKRAEQALRERTEELKATTQQLWQAARLAGVGELAASIAHELNNPLSTVSLRIEGLLTKTPTDDPRRKPLEVVEGEVERMAGLVANLLNFTRAGREQVSTVDVCDEVTKTVDLIGHHLRKRQIRVESDLAADIPVIHADRQQLRQVFLNLFTNAADAMPAGGRLTPRAGQATPRGGPGDRDRGHRHRRGHPRWPSGQGVRPVLHDQGGRQGNGARTRHLQAHCRATPWQAGGREYGRSRDDRPRHPPDPSGDERRQPAPRMTRHPAPRVPHVPLCRPTNR